MPLPRLFLRSVAESACADGVRFLASGVPFGGAAYDFAAGVLKRWREHKQRAKFEGELRDEVVVLVAAGMEELHEAIVEVVGEVASAEPLELRDALEVYLTRIPPAMQQSLKRVDDPRGLSVPFDLHFDTPEQVAGLLPARVSGFRAGESADTSAVSLAVGRSEFGRMQKTTHRRTKYLTIHAKMQGRPANSVPKGQDEVLPVRRRLTTLCSGYSS